MPTNEESNAEYTAAIRELRGAIKRFARAADALGLDKDSVALLVAEELGLAYESNQEDLIA